MCNRWRLNLKTFIPISIFQAFFVRSCRHRYAISLTYSTLHYVRVTDSFAKNRSIAKIIHIPLDMVQILTYYTCFCNSVSNCSDMSFDMTLKCLSLNDDRFIVFYWGCLEYLLSVTNFLYS